MAIRELRLRSRALRRGLRAAREGAREHHPDLQRRVRQAFLLAQGYEQNDDEGGAITRAAQSRFLGAHLGRWSGTFAEALKEASPLPYSVALADLLGAWMKAEIERLGATPSDVLGRSGYDPIQEAERFSCPMAEPEPAAEDPNEEP
jgi:hypothetical protein